MNDKFTERLKYAFDNASMADIARRIDVPHATIRHYFQGRMPSPEVLIKIANQTHVSLNWLLTGSGETFVDIREGLYPDDILERRVTEIVDRKLADLGLGYSRVGRPAWMRGAFDARGAVAEYGDPQTMCCRFRHEGRDYPEDFGVVFFQGWESFTAEEKLDAVLDAKKVLDRTLKKK